MRVEIQAPEGRHKGNEMCRPSGAAHDRNPYPPFKTAGYVVASLRDFERHKYRTPYIRAFSVYIYTGRRICPSLY